MRQTRRRAALAGRFPEEQAARLGEDGVDVQTQEIAENKEGSDRRQEEVPELQEGVPGRLQEEQCALGPLRRF